MTHGARGVSLVALVLITVGVAGPGEAAPLTALQRAEHFLRPIRGMAYEPTPSDYTPNLGPNCHDPNNFACRDFDSDYFNSDFTKLWADGPVGRGDLAQMARWGVNFLHLYNWTSAVFRDHIPFLTAAAAHGIKVAVPFSNFTLCEANSGGPHCNNTPDDRATPAKARANVNAIVGELVLNAHTASARIRPEVAMWSVGNEFDLSVYSAMIVADVTQMIIEAEEALGIVDNDTFPLIPITSPVSTGPYRGGPVNGIGATQALQLAFTTGGTMPDGTHVSGNAFLNSRQVWQRRFVAAINPFQVKAAIQNILEVQWPGSSVASVPLTFFEFDSGNTNSPQSQLNDMLANLAYTTPKAATVGDIFLGPFFFQFLDTWWKSGSEATFGAAQFRPLPPAVTRKLAGVSPGTTRKGQQFPVDQTFEKCVVNAITLHWNPSQATSLPCVGQANLGVAFGGGTALAELTIAAPRVATAGEIITRTVTVTNDGPGTATDVLLQVTLARGALLQSITPTQGACAATSPPTCELGNIPSGGSVLVTARIIPTGSGPMVTTAIAGSTEVDFDRGDNFDEATDTVNAFIVTGPGAGGGPRVRTFTGSGTPLAGDFLAYDAAFTRGVFVAAGRLAGAGGPVIFTGPGFGGASHVRGFDASGSTLATSFLAYDPVFAGGVRVAACDVDGDVWTEVVTGAGPGGGPHVKVIALDAAGTPIGDLASFLAFDAGFTGGVWVACADVDGDGTSDVVVGADGGGAPRVRVFSLAGGGTTELASFFAFDPGFTGGARVATGNVDGGDRAAIIVGAGPGGGPHVRVLKLLPGGLQELASFLAFNPAFPGGVSVATGDVDGDGLAEVIVGAGAGGGPHVGIFTGAGVPLGGFFAYEPSFSGGVTVGGVGP